jgi:hypothetical protein
MPIAATALHTETSSSVRQRSTAAPGVKWSSSGGFRFVNNKIVGTAGASVGYTVGFQVALTSGVSTSDLFIENNSIEGLTQAGQGVQLARLGATGGLSNIVISGNEFGGGQVCVNGPVDANGAWLTGVTITGNACEPTHPTLSVAYQFLVSVNGLYIGGGTVWAPRSTNNVAVSTTTQTATNCAIGPLPKVGSFTTSNISVCTSYAPN